MKRMTLKGLILTLMLVWAMPSQGFAVSGEKQFKSLISSIKKIEKVQLYTAYNLFADHGKVRAINFRVGNMIPAGTPVEVQFIEEFEYPLTATGDLIQQIRFTTLPDARSYTLEFTQRYHPGKTIYEYANLMFTKNTFAEMTAGKSTDVINAIRRSAVIEGMSKEEVIISYGHPAEHRTPNPRSNTWVYWENRYKKKQICFDEEERAISCEKQRVQDL